MLRGNYDDAIGHERDDCACGYTDPRDQQFAQLSYDYTAARTSAQHKAWMRGLPEQAPARARRPPRAALPRLAAARERVPVGVDVLGRVPRMAVRDARRRRHPVHAHRAALAPRAPERAPRRQRRRDRPAGRTTGTPRSGYAAIEIDGDSHASSSGASPTTTKRSRARWKTSTCPPSSSRRFAPAGGRPASRIFPPRSGGAESTSGPRPRAAISLRRRAGCERSTRRGPAPRGRA